MKKSILVVVMVFMVAVADAGAEISVPGDYSTIQGAIDAAVDGNTIVVSPGTYYESIEFGGKDIVVTSTDPWDWGVVESTIINANGLYHVVVFDASETAACLLEGLTLTGGDANYNDETDVHLKAGGVLGGPVVGTATSATINRCLIVGNRAAANGSAVWNFAGEIRNCRIEGNYAGRSGVLALCYGPIVNCLVRGNTNGLLDKYVMHSLQGPILNCTIVDNLDSTYPGYAFAGCTGEIENCIVWGNEIGLGTFVTSSEPAYSCIEGYSGGGVNNISSDPCFVDAAAGDYHLLAESPCINAGDPAYFWGPDELDIDGEPRIMAGRVDIGAYELVSVESVLIVTQNVFFDVLEDEPSPAGQMLRIWTGGLTGFSWTIEESCDWLTVSEAAGSTEGAGFSDVLLSVDVTGLAAGDYSCELTVIAEGALNSPQVAEVNLHITRTIRVSLDGSGDFFTIQAGIDAAVYGDTINVKAGTYIENITLKNGVALVGEGADECIIDGNSNGPVIYSSRCNSQTTITRFTITNGSGHINQYGRTLGGGMYNNYSNPTITYCVFTGNSVEYGGGIYNDNRSHPEIRNCLFIDNIAEWWGGGIVNYHYSNPKVLSCNFYKNTARYGGGIYNYNSSNAEIRNCVFKENLATSQIFFSCGGGIYNDKGSNSFISSCLFIDNTVSDAGGGVYNRSSSPTVINCTFNGNWADIYGGAIGNYDASNPRVANCILWKNRARHDGNEVYDLETSGSEPCIPIFSHCNISNSGGSGINWDVLIGIDGGGNIDTNPLFVNPAEKDFRLMFDSPCIDMGDPDSEFQPGATDLDGNPRIDNGIVDMGAYEFVNTAPIADAGDGQTVYVCKNGIAAVELDGSGSMDADGDELEYFWFIGDEQIAAGVNPTVELGVGEYLIELIVYDGIEESEPDEVVVTVVGPVEADVHIVPWVINRNRRGRKVIAIITLPEGIGKNDIDGEFTLYPGEITAGLQLVRENNGIVKVFALFDKGALIAAVSSNGPVELTVVGRLTTGECVSGWDSVRITRPRRRRVWRRRVWRRR